MKCASAACVIRALPGKYYCAGHFTPSPEAVSPAHYSKRIPEPITVIEDWNLDFCRANAVKYIARAGQKDGQSEAQDLRKAIAYLSRLVNKLEGKRGWKLESE